MTPHLRIARPCTDLAAAERFYVEGLGLEVLHRGTASAPGEHDLLMVGAPDAAWHLELVLGGTPAPSEEDLLVLYLGEPAPDDLVARLVAYGGTVVSQGPYWDRWAVTVRDHDGYRLALSSRTWANH
ncbi:VOC family protein [Symbioplanes lichenis]|uniref:VOC family protein n=1 Tax=Symbioplanes lichenis TaxID=1629072 RepID=UPI0027389DCA|nr:VOC family protein [Actinoplanes lichenis]